MVVRLAFNLVIFGMQYTLHNLSGIHWYPRV